MKYLNVCLAGICATLAISVFAQKHTKLNVIILLADDMGHGD